MTAHAPFSEYFYPLVRINKYIRALIPLHAAAYFHGKYHTVLVSLAFQWLKSELKNENKNTLSSRFAPFLAGSRVLVRLRKLCLILCVFSIPKTRETRLVRLIGWM